MSKQSLTWTTIRVPLGNLKEWDKNPATISERDARQLAKSLDRYDHVLPYIAAAPKNGGKELPLLDGHQRKAVELSLRRVDPKTLVDVRVPSRKLTEKERAELSVRLRRNVGEWNADALLNWFESGDLLEWGFEQKELENFGFEFGEEGSDAEPQVDRAGALQKKWKTKPGQLWTLGTHRLFIGDCTIAEDVEILMDGKKCGACVTDPPYGQDQVDVTGDEPENHAELLAGCIRNVPIENGIVIAFQSPRTFPNWMQAISNHKFLRALWLYKEAQMANPWRGWIMKSEMILISEIGKGKWVEVHPYAHDCYKLSEVSFRTEKIAAVRPHGSVKPLVVVSDLVSRVGGDVYEPFAGSGTTLIACENLQRKCYAMEIDPKYAAVILQRYNDAFPGIEIKRLK